MTELQIELSEAIKKIVSISERVKENPELGKDLTYIVFAIDPEQDGVIATLGASQEEVVSILIAVMEKDERFKQSVMIANAVTRMKTTIASTFGTDFAEFLKTVMSEKKEGEAKEGSEGDGETV